jgi:hypothetical protein
MLSKILLFCLTVLFTDATVLNNLHSAYTILNFNTQLSCNVVDATTILKWNQTEVSNIKKYMFNGELICTTHYNLCAYRQDNLFGFLPIDLVEQLGMYQVCMSLMQHDDSYIDQCQNFTNNLKIALNIAYFSFPDTLLDGPKFVQYFMQIFGGICENVISTNYQFNNSFWTTLYPYSNILCYPNSYFVNLFLDNPWRTDNQYSSQVYLTSDYHIDAINDKGTLMPNTTYYEMLIARANISKCYYLQKKLQSNDGTILTFDSIAVIIFLFSSLLIIAGINCI